MLFSLVMLYAMHHFARYDNKDNDVGGERGASQREDSLVDMNFKAMFLRNNNLSFDSEREGK